MGFLVFALLTIVVDFAASQSLVLVGGNLNDGNEAIWGKVVELAVHTQFHSSDHLKCLINFTEIL